MCKDNSLYGALGAACVVAIIALCTRTTARSALPPPHIGKQKQKQKHSKKQKNKEATKTAALGASLRTPPPSPRCHPKDSHSTK